MYLINAQIVRVTEEGQTICQDVPLFYIAVEPREAWAPTLARTAIAEKRAHAMLANIIKPFDDGQLKEIHVFAEEM